MTIEQRDKYAYELMVKNNPEEAVKQLLLKDKENEKLKSKIDEVINKQLNIEEKFNYKSRIDKAIELLKESGCYDEKAKIFCDDVWNELPDLLNILKGEE